MSLLARYPLNKDFLNYGLDGVDMEPAGNIGLTDQSPFGSALNCIADPTKYLVRDGFKLIKDFTMCCWVKINAAPTTENRCCILSEGRTSQAIECRRGFNICYWANKFSICIGGTKNGEYVPQLYSFYTPNLGQWYHIAVTVEERGIDVYVDGTLAGTFDYIAPDYSQSDGKFVIGKASCGHITTNGFYPLNGAVNDVRIYDNALSTREIKEISKGLTLHFPMNQMDKPKNNLVDVDSFTSSVGSGGFGSVASGYYNDLMTGASVYKSQLTILDSSISSKWFIITCPVKYDYFTVGKKYFVQFWIRLNSDTTSAFFRIQESGAINNIFGSTLKITASANTWTKVSGIFTCVLQPDTKSRFYIAPGTFDGSTIEIREPMVVECDSDILDVSYCPDYGDTNQWFDGIEYDTSGFNNHGTISSNIDNIPYSAYSSVGPCYDFNSEKRYIFGQNPLLLNSAVSFSFWMYFDSTIPLVGAACVFTARTATGLGLAFFLYSSNSIRFDTGSGSTGQFTITGQLLPAIADAWHHVVLTRDLSIKKVYIDGELIASTTTVGIMDGISSTMSIGASLSSPSNISSTNYFRGKLKDFRMYVTALSAEDAKALYQTKQMVTDRSVLLTGEIINQ